MENNEDQYDWDPSKMLEIILDQPDDFLKVAETLTRMGVPSTDGTKLFQSCHILHKQGHYFIVHFKELFGLDGSYCDMNVTDVGRRNLIASLLEDWGLLKIVDHDALEDTFVDTKQLKIISFAEKKSDRWLLVPKYSIGKKKGYGR